jgi:iron complex transport system substrate-binding protein
VDVRPPWAPDGAPVRYLLVQCGTPAPDDEGVVVQVPPHEVVTLTTTNLPHFAALAAVDRVVGVGTAALVTTQAVRDRIAEGHVDDYADAAGQPDLERLIDREPDLVIVDGFGDAILDEAARLSDAAIPAVINADFNEETLLGRAEWLKFTALFLNAEQTANEAFSAIAARYEEVAGRVAEAAERPVAFANTPFQGVWYVPGGASHLANAVADAGGDYVFADDAATGALELDLETVLDRAGDADVWLQAGSVHTSLDDLLAQDERFARFRAFQKGEVWAYDRWVTPEGGYAVFEVAYTRADLFLADLAKIFHPELMEDHDLTFFGRVGELAED